MSNNYFNFRIPNFQDKYGSDWAGFKEVIDEYVDYTFLRTFALYHINDINKMSDKIVKIMLDILQVYYSQSDSNATKRNKLRIYAGQFKKKGMEDMYLDICETVTGTRGYIKNDVNNVFEAWRWSSMRWGETSRWTSQPYAHIYINAKTGGDAGLIALVLEALRHKSVRPAFYYVAIIDDNDNVEGVV